MLKLLLALTFGALVVSSSQDAGELALWLPGLAIGCIGLALGGRRHFTATDLFFILFLFLFVLAPADQIEGRRFLGEISVRGIVFPEHVLVRSVVLADVFGACVVAVKVISLLREGPRPPWQALSWLRRARAPLEGPGSLALVGAGPMSGAVASAGADTPAAEPQPAGALARVAADDGMVTADRAATVGAGHDVVLDDWSVEDGGSLDEQEEMIIQDWPEGTEPAVAVEPAGALEAGSAVSGAATAASLAGGDAVEAAAVPSARRVRRVTATAIAAPPRDRRMVWLLVLVALADIAMLGLVTAATGGPGFIYAGRGYTEQLFAGNQALAVLVQAFLQIVPVLGVILGIVHWQRCRDRSAVLWLVALSALCLLFDNPLNTARFQFGAYALMVALFALRGRIPMVVCHVGLLGYLLLVMPLMNVLRNGGAAAFSTLDRNALGLDFKHLDFDAFSMFTCAVYRTGDSGFAGGSYTLSVLLFFVPRSLWPDKPQPSSIDLGQFLMQHHSGWFDNLSCPPFGDLYMDFGTFGVIVCGLLYGAMLAWSDRVLLTWDRSTLFRCGLAAAVMGFLPILVRGSLAAVIGGFVVTALLFLVSSRLVPRKEAPELPAGRLATA